MGVPYSQLTTNFIANYLISPGHYKTMPVQNFRGKQDALWSIWKW